MLTCFDLLIPQGMSEQASESQSASLPTRVDRLTHALAGVSDNIGEGQQGQEAVRYKEMLEAHTVGDFWQHGLHVKLGAVYWKEGVSQSALITEPRRVAAGMIVAHSICHACTHCHRITMYVQHNFRVLPMSNVQAGLLGSEHSAACISPLLASHTCTWSPGLQSPSCVVCLQAALLQKFQQELDEQLQEQDRKHQAALDAK
jgi:hypothetical protein